MRSVGIVFFVMLFLHGCAVHTVEPENSLSLPAEWHEASDPLSVLHAVDASPGPNWWQAIGGPELDALVEGVLTANLDIARAEQRLLASRAAEKEVRSLLWPLVDLTASVARFRLSENSGTTSAALGGPEAPSQAAGGQLSGAPGQTLNRFSTRAQVNYDLDFWGRNRYAVKGAEALRGAREAEVRAISLLIIGDTVRAFLDLLLANDLVGTDREIVDLQRRNLRLLEARQSAGLTTVLELSDAGIRFAQAEALLAGAEKSRSLAAHRISLLLGETSGARDLPSKGITDLQPTSPVPVGVPSTVLRSRPDIEASALQLKAAAANVGSLKAELLPSFVLIGSGGLESQELSDWLKIASRTWLIGLSAFQTLFDGGARRARVEEGRAIAEEAVLSYRQTVLRSFTEVEDALVAVTRDRQERDSMRHLASARHVSLKAIMAQSEAGLTDDLRLVDVQAQSLDSRINVAVSERNFRESLLSLYLALGAPVNER